MQIINSYSHLNASEIIKKKQVVWPEIDSVLNNSEVEFGPTRPSEIKKVLNSSFNRLGWADRVRVHPNLKLTISFLKENVGVCLQLGNVSRTYADIIKLELLGERGIIDVGCIVVPDAQESKLLGANYARFDRLQREAVAFKKILNTPILILALGN
ncbi:MAG: hypothetical protein H6653_14230 [Ardenticatenaceae bacterium]|nr:hypothetical protein [Ardenticatenaceae bacterium]